MLREKLGRVWVAGHNGMVGSAVTRELEARGVHVLKVNRAQLELRDQAAVERWLKKHRPDTIVFAAAKVGGIYANNRFPADFIYDNLAIELNVIHSAHLADVNHIAFLGSSCIYPRLATQPIREDAILTGELEPTNQWYAVAKIAGLKLCQAYRKQHGRHYFCIMPCNLYGPHDNFDPMNSHVIPGLIQRFDAAKAANLPEVAVWGTGTPRREFMHVDDLAQGVTFALHHYDGDDPINCGAGSDISIADLARTIAQVIGYRGRITFDHSMPDGTPRKLMDSSRMTNLGWKPTIDFASGITDVVGWYRSRKR